MVLSLIPLTDRAVIRLAGNDAPGFLQGLITNDIEKAAPGRSIWAALLSPQGKYLFDFFIVKSDQGFLLDTNAARADELIKKLSAYKLRANVAIERMDLQVHALLNEAAHENVGLPGSAGAATVFQGMPAFVDPRWVPLGVRLFSNGTPPLPFPTLAATRENYQRLRIMHGIPEGSEDATIDRTIILENGYDALGAIDYTKGCYVGQEVIARTTHRGVMRKRLFCVEADAHLPPFGTEITAGAVPIGEMRSSCGHVGLAVIRLEEWEKAQHDHIKPNAGTIQLVIHPPEWHRPVPQSSQTQRDSHFPT